MRSRLWLVLALAAACGGDDDGGGGGSDGGGDDPDAGGQPIDCESSAGEVAASGVVRLGDSVGSWATGPRIEGIFTAGTDWQFFALAPQYQVESARAGDCILYEWEPSFCDPACEAGQCHQGECKPFPEVLSAGEMRVDIG